MDTDSSLWRDEMIMNDGSHSLDNPVDFRSVITIEPGKRSGKPCVRGMRIAVVDVLDWLASGMSIDEILADFPELTPEDIRACVAFAAARERDLYRRNAAIRPDAVGGEMPEPDEE